MSKKVKLLAMTMSLLLSFGAVGCGSNSTNEKSNNDAVDMSKIDIWEKYDPPIEITVVGSYGTPEDPTVPPETTLENQKWVEIFEEYLGIKLKYEWVVPMAQAEQKMDITIASGKLPDILMVGEKQFEFLKDSDMLGDLSEAYNYLEEEIRTNIEVNDAVLKKCSNEDGEIVAIPNTLDSLQQAQLIYIREDWLDKLGLELPKTLDDLQEIATQFTKNDPDGNGKDDTYGIAMYKDIVAGLAGMQGVFSAYNSYPGIWIKDKEGNLVNGDVQPETREALLKLQEFYKEGIIDPEYVAMDSSKIAEKITGSKYGIVYGEWWVPNWPLNLNIDSDPNARWKAINLVSTTEEPAKTDIKKAFIGVYNIISKDFEHPEALAKMLNLYYDTAFTGSEGDTFPGVIRTDFMYNKELFKPENGYVYNWTPARLDDTFVQTKNFKAVNEAIEKNDPSTLKNPNMKNLYENYEGLQKEFNSTDWGLYYSRVDKDGGWGLTEKVRENNLYVYNEFYGAYTPTMITTQGALDTLKNEVFHRIISGAPIEEFDKFVSDWNKMGGEAITKEVNEWYATQK